MSLRRVIFTSMCVGGSIMMAAAAKADVVFSDGTFSNYQTGFVASTGGATLASSKCANCGDPGSALNLVISDSDGSNLGAAIINPLFSYNPQTQGTIASINASVDKDLTVIAPPLFAFGNTFRPVIEQNGAFYTAAIFGPAVTVPVGGTTATSGYNLFTAPNLTAADFNQFDTATGLIGTNHPDFSGSAILFGLGQVIAANPADAGHALTVTSTFDNLSIAVHAVPEPATWALFIGGFGLVGWSLRRRPVREATISFA